ncbi:hypothetical protein [Cellulomonas massiliensis]|uniref:hypothetical protein n=1 Tax=Cellulomonas massiliensis TaxID=1465811 RepID=UPI0002D9F255|nr:hypothetical protein [Cellulomonas massiliensis]
MSALRARLDRSGDDTGFSLAEVLVAMMLFMLVSTGLIYSMLSVLHATRDSRARITAANLAAEEIDLARSTGDLFALLDDSYPVTVRGQNFTVTRKARWVSDPDQDFQCGASGSGASSLRYKRVNVSVSWEGMRGAEDPVQLDTVVNPAEHINDPDKGTILVSVLKADGTGAEGVTVTASPSVGSVISPTDAQGCTYVLKVAPGTYTVGVSKANFVTADQQTSGSKSVIVTAGTASSVGFQMDGAGTFTARLAQGTSGAKVPTDLRTTFWNTYGLYPSTPASGSGTQTQTFKLHPYTSGYSAYAGVCAAADPAQWPEMTSGGSTLRGVPVDPVAAAPLGTATIDVPMGVVKLKGFSSGGTFLKAESVNASGGDPGCATTTTYVFGSVLPTSSGTQVTVVLPYGSWRFYRGTSATSMTTAIGSSDIVLPTTLVPERTTKSTVGGAAVVTFDPRVAVTP